MTDDFEEKARIAGITAYGYDFDEMFVRGAKWAREQIPGELPLEKYRQAFDSKLIDEVSRLKTELEQANCIKAYEIEMEKGYASMKASIDYSDEIDALKTELEQAWTKCKKLKAQIKAWAEKWTTQNDQSGTFRLWQEKDNEIEQASALLEKNYQQGKQEGRAEIQAENDKLQKHFDNCSADKIVTLNLEIERLKAEIKVWKDLDAVSNKQSFLLQDKLDQADIDIKELKSQLELRLNDKNCAHVIAFEDYLELQTENRKLRAKLTKFEGLLDEAFSIIWDFVPGFTVWIDEARAALKGDVE